YCAAGPPASSPSNAVAACSSNLFCDSESGFKVNVLLRHDEFHAAALHAAGMALEVVGLQVQRTGWGVVLVDGAVDSLPPVTVHVDDIVLVEDGLEGDAPHHAPPTRCVRACS